MRNKNKNKRIPKEICGKPCTGGLTEAARAWVCCRAKGHPGECGSWGLADVAALDKK